MIGIDQRLQICLCVQTENVILPRKQKNHISVKKYAIWWYKRVFYILSYTWQVIPVSKDIHSGWTHLIGHHDQGVLVFWKKIEEAPQSKSILLRQHSAAGLVCSVVFLCRKSPAELIHIFFNKRAFNNLQQKNVDIKKQLNTLVYTALQFEKK